MTTLYVYKSQNSGWTYLYHDEAGRRVDGPNGIDSRTDALLLGCHRVSPSQVRFGRPSDFPEEADLLSTQCELRHARADLFESARQLKGTQECREMYASRWAATLQELDLLKMTLRDLVRK